MKKTSIFSLALTLAVGSSLNAAAQSAQDVATKYRRSSIYSLLISHNDQKFADEIKRAFVAMPVPDKYNDHDFSVKVVEMSSKLKGVASDNENTAVTQFLETNHVASRLVGKWFNRDIYTGTCDMELIKERGLYNAGKFDHILSERSARSQALMMDAGEQLIGNTFVLVNDIRYIDKENTGKVVGGLFRALGQMAGYSDLGNNLGSMMETLKGFRVKINTFLYQLNWDEQTAFNFYKDQYTEQPDITKFNNFDNSRANYKLTYAGKVESSGSTTSFLGVNLDDKDAMVRKACQRALDENVVALQTQFPAFRTKSPIVTTEPLTAFVGMKEGVNAKSKFEVLEEVEAEDGTRSYHKVAEIVPIEGKIWDNRYMASEEGAEGADLGCTTFRKVSGKDILAGMLIREVK